MLWLRWFCDADDDFLTIVKLAVPTILYFMNVVGPNSG